MLAKFGTIRSLRAPTPLPVALATKRSRAAEKEALMSNKNNRGHYFLSPMDDEINGKANLGEGGKKNSVSRERLDLEMSELAKPVICRATGLFEAVRDGIVDLLKDQLVKKQNAKEMDKLDQSGLALLHHAVRYNRVNVAEALLDHGARIDVRTREDNLTPLHIAAR